MQEEHQFKSLKKLELILCKLPTFRKFPKSRRIPTKEDPQMVLKRCVLIFSDLIFESRVDRGMPSLTAAPNGPDTRPLVSARAVSILSFSRATSSSESGLFSGGVFRVFRESQFSSISSVSVSQTMTARSITF